ncbi:MAG: hypothetical protein BIFFINMI_03712 [Phycisphaerae bacterium]|nr:hypothetical protein [Phycisphaerae bacterium]
MACNRKLAARRRGNATGWIIVLVILLGLAAVVAWKMATHGGMQETAPTTQPDTE